MSYLNGLYDVRDMIEDVFLPNISPSQNPEEATLYKYALVSSIIAGIHDMIGCEVDRMDAYAGKVGFDE